MSARLKTRDRRRALYATIRQLGGEWTTTRVLAIYRGIGVCCRSTARHDLADLARRGLLNQREMRGRRVFTLNTATGGGR